MFPWFVINRKTTVALAIKYDRERTTKFQAWLKAFWNTEKGREIITEEVTKRGTYKERKQKTEIGRMQREIERGKGD